MNPTHKYLLYARLNSEAYFVRLAGAIAAEENTETRYFTDLNLLLNGIQLLDICCDEAFDRAEGHVLVATFDNPHELHITHPELFI